MQRKGTLAPESVVRLVKWLWLALVVPSLAVLLYRYRAVLSEQIGALQGAQLLVSLSALLAAKILLSRGSWLALRAQGTNLSYGSMFAMVSISQLGKYAPGAVVHLLGRGWLYSRKGVPVDLTARALVLENVWQWMAAALVGTLFLAAVDLDSGQVHANAFMRAVAAAALGALGWWVVNRILQKRLGTSNHHPSVHIWGALTTFSLAWLFCGLSLFAIWPEAFSASSLLLATGAFAVASIAGFLAPFAPAGIGVREAALVAVTAPVLATDQAIGLAAISRAVWIVGEILLATAGWQLTRPRTAGASK